MSITPQIALVPGSRLLPTEDPDLVADLQGVAAALQIQVDKHFSPVWNIEASIGYFDDFAKVPAGFWPPVDLDRQPTPKNRTTKSVICWKCAIRLKTANMPTASTGLSSATSFYRNITARAAPQTTATKP